MLTEKIITIQFEDYDWNIEYTHDDEYNTIHIKSAIPLLDDYKREAIIDIIEEEEEEEK